MSSSVLTPSVPKLWRTTKAQCAENCQRSYQFTALLTTDFQNNRDREIRNKMYEQKFSLSNLARSYSCIDLKPAYDY